MSSTTNSNAARRAIRPIAIALIQLAAVAALAGCAQHRTAPPESLPPPPSGMPSAEPLTPPVPVDNSYRADVENSVAERLHTTVAAIYLRLHGQPSSTLLVLAKPAGLAQDQLAAIITSALNSATSDAERAGHLDVAQAAQLTRYWSAQSTPDLITEASYWYLHDPISPGASR